MQWNLAGMSNSQLEVLSRALHNHQIVVQGSVDYWRDILNFKSTPGSEFNHKAAIKFSQFTTEYEVVCGLYSMVSRWIDDNC